MQAATELNMAEERLAKDEEGRESEQECGEKEEMMMEMETPSGIPFLKFLEGDTRPIMLVGVW